MSSASARETRSDAQAFPATVVEAVVPVTPQSHDVDNVPRVELGADPATIEPQHADGDSRAGSRLQELFDRFTQLECRPRFVNLMMISAHCPVHDDQRPSLNATVAADGAILLYCHACGREAFAAIAAKLGLPLAWFGSAWMHPNARVIRAAGALQLYIKKVTPLPNITPRDKLLLLYLAARVNLRETGQIYGSIKNFAAGTNMAPRTVQTSLRRLKEAGLLAWRSGNSHGVSNEYFLQVVPSALEAGASGAAGPEPS